MASPERIDAELADLQKRGILPPAQPSTGIDRYIPGASGVPAFLKSAGRGIADAAQSGTVQLMGMAPPPEPPADQQAPYDRQIEIDQPNAAMQAAPARQPTGVQSGGEIPEVAAQARGAPSMVPQLQGPQYVPPHFDESQVPIKPGTRKEILGTFDTIAKTEQVQARLRAEQADVQANALATEADRAKRSMANRLVEEDTRRNMVRQQMGKLQEVTDAARGGRVDPDQVMKAKGSLGRFFAGVGIALGAGLQARNGGSNPALDILNEQIRQNIDAQKANLALAHQDVLGEDNLLGKYRDMFGDERLAELAFENTSREVAIQHIQAEAAKRQAPMIQANAAEMIAKLRQQQLATQADFEKMAFVRGFTTGGAGNAGAAIKQDGNIVRLPNGRAVRFSTEKEAIEARSKLTAAYNTIEMYDQAGELRKKLGSLNPVTSPLEYHKTLSELNALAERILPEWSLSHGQGQVKEEEAKRYKQNLFPFARIFDPAADRIIEQGKKKEVSQVDNLVRGSSGEYVDEGYALDKTGRVVKDDSLTTQAPQGKKIAVPTGFKPFGAK